MAGVVAATLLGRNLNAYRISYSYEEGVEGPSAGALTTAALVALMRGQVIADDVAMTGTVNPDGTVGPVDGIAQKIAGAHARTKRFGIPVGHAWPRTRALASARISSRWGARARSTSWRSATCGRPTGS